MYIYLIFISLKNQGITSYCCNRDVLQPQVEVKHVGACMNEAGTG